MTLMETELKLSLTRRDEYIRQLEQRNCKLRDVIALFVSGADNLAAMERALAALAEDMT